ncbi:TPA: hypothetical protein I7765_00170 [Vibrio vulnificus]|nr:hypothetical protein FORC54_3880 [Vibrio vulnificus]PNM65927.1 hypothetical protein AL546_006480 [Vibrio vulnificus]RZQ77667.1 hypothetical protein D8T30_05145 [Vibrio vulnificus]RZR02719.1 hypothetical protein D8T29_05015 [Vibrio vulnificus]RZR40039.1 hypothetical protein D8T59_05465 [Vibrio vulnificus]
MKMSDISQSSENILGFWKILFPDSKWLRGKWVKFSAIHHRRHILQQLIAAKAQNDKWYSLDYWSDLMVKFGP